jgi:hypothetical protein
LLHWSRAAEAIGVLPDHPNFQKKKIYQMSSTQLMQEHRVGKRYVKHNLTRRQLLNVPSFNISGRQLCKAAHALQNMVQENIARRQLK